MMRPVVSEDAVLAAAAVLRSGWIGQGPRVAALEERFAQLVGAPSAVAVNSVAAATRLALAVAGVGPEDEVVTTPLVCTATNHPILEQFARPVFADVQPTTCNIDPADVVRRVTSRTKAILCTHWGGYPCDLDELNAVAASAGIPVIEDATDAVGAVYRGRRIGGVSTYTAFSFGAVQLLTTVEGGMLTVRPPGDTEAARRRRWFGIDRVGRRPSSDGYYEFDVTEPGYGYHLSDVAAAIGLAHLDHFTETLFRRRTIAGRYRSALADVPGVRLLAAEQDRESACGLFTMRVERRDDFHRALRERGVETSVVHVRNDTYTVFGGRRSDLPGMDALEKTYICLPLHGRLSDEDVEHVIKSVGAGW